MLSNARVVAIAVGILALVGAAVHGVEQSSKRTAALASVEVYKTPTCGCCQKWVDHLKANGFTVKVSDFNDLDPVKERHGVPADLGSCHTAVTGGYVVEGHVPAADIQRLLKERPKVAGIAVPSMPAGSPGMEIPSGRVQPYRVIAFDKSGKTSVFATHGVR